MLTVQSEEGASVGACGGSDEQTGAPTVAESGGVTVLLPVGASGV